MCMQFATILNVYAPTVEWIASYIACHFRQYFHWHSQYHKYSYKGGLNTKNNQMMSIGSFFNSTYHTKQLHPWPNLPASHVMI